MCTAINQTVCRHVFGRTLDMDRSPGESIVITPRRHRLSFLHTPALAEHYAMIGIAHLREGCALYYDACNEFGLCAAALEFPKLACYHAPTAGKRNVASFELIPFLLSQCKTVAEAAIVLREINVTSDEAARELPPTPLHWLIGDKQQSLCIEPTAEGLRLHTALSGVLTNAPAYDEQCARLADFTARSPAPSGDRVAVGLPGDFSSPSRFVRAAFASAHTLHEEDAAGEMLRHFHVLGTVSVPAGCSRNEQGRAVRTVYTVGYDTATRSCHYTTYHHPAPRVLTMTEAAMTGEALTSDALPSVGGI